MNEPLGTANDDIDLPADPDHAAGALAWLAHQRVTLRRVPRPPGADDSLLEEPSESSSEAAARKP